MHTVHNGLTISTQIKSGQRESLEQLLNEINDSKDREGAIFEFNKLATVHFITWIIVNAEETPEGKKLPERLLLMTSYTGSKKVHYAELVEIGITALHEVYSHCEDYSYENCPTRDHMVRFLKSFSKANTYYTGFQYITHLQVVQENQLRDAIQLYLDKQQDDEEFLSLDVRNIRIKIQEFVKSKPEFDWATKPVKKTFGNFWNLYGGMVIMLSVLGILILLSIAHIFIPGIITLVGLCLLISLILFIAFLLIGLRINESNPHIPVTPVSDQRIHEIVSKETFPVKNEMSVITPLKTGSIRPIFLAVTLWLVQRVRASSYIPSVHTARWVQIDKGKRFVFIAYFDNTSEGYAHDFVDSTKRTRNLNLIFGHALGFPVTRFAILGGGKDRKGYITGVRANQKIAQVWYSTNQTLGILNIKNNNEIRKGLFGKLKEEEIEQWLLKL
ncbi:hypothetical protein [Aquimarina sediminis]|uniref:hypothetical protein n=1 Tax=Aquimarina sediminis TaxID=2070536 RepID=UPI000CA007EA|nr:hypothetical protein [Aquimarina sediminis]